jgi:hypothetical protein
MASTLLFSDEDLSNMFLTDKKLKISRSPNDHVEVELLLEHFQGLIEGELIASK